MAHHEPDPTAPGNERAIAWLLEHRFGDGSVYVPPCTTAGLLQQAIRQGYLSEQGYITRKGRWLLCRRAAVPGAASGPQAAAAAT